MPRKLLYKTDYLPYHVTARANNKEPFPVDMNEMWSLFGTECFHLNLVYDVEFHAAVLMPNHFHMILTVPESDLGKVMNILQSNLTRIFNQKSGKSGHLFGGPYHWSLINSARYFGHAFKYVYRNPVRAKLVDRVEDYPFSTLHGLVGNSHLPFPIHFSRAGMMDGIFEGRSEQFLYWLNQPFPSEVEPLIKHGLSRKIFEKIKTAHTRKVNTILESFL